MDSHARLHAGLIAFLRQHGPACDEHHLVLLGWMVTGLLLSQTVCFDPWKRSIPLNRCLPEQQTAEPFRCSGRRLSNPSASVSAEVVIALLQRAERLLVGVPAITVLADRAFPTADLLRWLEVRRHHGR